MAAETYPGNLFIIAAPSGTGKTTLYKRLLADDSRLTFSVSHTTRQPRDGEMNGRDYHFVSREAFETSIQAGAFLEWAEVHGNLYGTAGSSVDARLAEGRDVLLDIDVQGARQVLEKRPETCSIFILPPNYQTLHDRLTSRGQDAPSTIARRLNNAVDEVQHVGDFHYVLVNDDLDTCYGELCAIITATRLVTGQRSVEIQRIIETFPQKG